MNSITEACECCECHKPLEEESTDTFHTEDSKVYCTFCANVLFIFCDVCGDDYWHEKMQWSEAKQKYYCELCLEKYPELWANVDVE
ncbi:MAG: hypothetical protein HQK99_12545 [Nitrospirae bacterium]|nr:hypothetical protein [Nitrospirota bacterium]